MDQEVARKFDTEDAEQRSSKERLDEYAALERDERHSIENEQASRARATEIARQELIAKRYGSGGVNISRSVKPKKRGLFGFFGKRFKRNISTIQK